MPDAINDFARVINNSFLGIVGFMDVATDLGVEMYELREFSRTASLVGESTGHL